MSTNDTAVTTWEAVEAFIKVEMDDLYGMYNGEVPEAEAAGFADRLFRFRTLVDTWCFETPEEIAKDRKERWGE